MAAHSSILAWRIPWIEEPSGRQSMGQQRVGHDQATFTRAPLRGSQPCCGKGAFVTQWSCEPGHTGPPRMDQSQWRVLTKCGSLKEEMAASYGILATRTPWQYEKANRYDTGIRASRVQGVQRATEGNGGWLLLAPERMKWLGQSGTDASVVDVSGGESKAQCCQEQ